MGAVLALLLSLNLVGCQKPAEKGGETGVAKAADDAGKGEKGKEADAKGEGGEGEKKEEAPLPTVVVVTARTGAVAKTLPVSGTLAVPREDEATLSPPVAGVVDALPVRFGQTVRKGQVVLHLSTQTLVGQIAQARATIGQYTVQVQQAEANALLQQGQSRTALLQAQTTVSNARANLLAAQATLKGAEATLTGNVAALENARQTLTRTQSLFGEGLVARKDVEAAELAVHSAEAQVAAQKQTVAAQEDTVAAQKQTVAGLEQAAQAAGLGKIQNTVKQKDIAVARQQLANAQGALRTLEAQEALYTVRAPISGTVTAANAAMGESVDTTTKILTIDRLDRLQVQIAVPSASVGAVRVGQPLIFHVDSLPNQTFQAVVRTIGTQIDSTNSTLLVLADVNNPRHVLKNGLTARVSLVLARHDKTTVLPPNAVFYEAGSVGTSGETGFTAAHVLKIDRDNAVHVSPVTVGFSDDNGVEILTGVQPGERVVTTGGYGLPDGTKVQVEGETNKNEKEAAPADEAKDEKGKKP